MKASGTLLSLALWAIVNDSLCSHSGDDGSGSGSGGPPEACETSVEAATNPMAQLAAICGLDRKHECWLALVEQGMDTSIEGQCRMVSCPQDETICDLDRKHECWLALVEQGMDTSIEGQCRMMSCPQDETICDLDRADECWGVMEEEGLGLMEDWCTLVVAGYSGSGSGGNGEEVCEGHSYDEDQCNGIGCCHWNAGHGQCYSSVGTGPCTLGPGDDDTSDASVDDDDVSDFEFGSGSGSGSGSFDMDGTVTSFDKDDADLTLPRVPMALTRPRVAASSVITGISKAEFMADGADLFRQAVAESVDVDLDDVVIMKVTEEASPDRSRKLRLEELKVDFVVVQRATIQDPGWVDDLARRMLETEQALADKITSKLITVHPDLVVEVDVKGAMPALTSTEIASIMSDTEEEQESNSFTGLTEEGDADGQTINASSKAVVGFSTWILALWVLLQN